MPKAKHSFQVRMSQLIREDTFEEKRVLVIPAVLMAEGVHNGVLYTREELAKFPEAWNGQPVTATHPMKDGEPVTANTPETLEKVKVGTLFNVHLGVIVVSGERRLAVLGEVWLDPVKADEADPAIMQHLNADKIIEVSTGTYEEHEMRAGEWNGEAFDAVALNGRPDHFALLPEGRGACSVADGAGMPRVNHAVFAVNELSHWGVREQLAQALHERYGIGAYIVDVWDDVFVYERGDMDEFKFYRRKYSVGDEEKVSLGDDEPEEVIEKREFVVVNEQRVNQSGEGLPGSEPEKTGGVNVEKAEIVSALIVNADSQFTEEDRVRLMALDDDVLVGLTPLAPPVPPTLHEVLEGDPGDDESDAAKAARVAFVATVTANQDEGPEGEDKPMTADEYLAAAPPALQAVLRYGLAAHAKQKKAFVAILVANEACPFDEAELVAKEVSELEKLVRLMQMGVPRKSGDNFGRPMPNGQAKPVVRGESDEEPLEMPSLLVAKEA